jgi:signal transduction histidine kinase
MSFRAGGFSAMMSMLQPQPAPASAESSDLFRRVVRAPLSPASWRATGAILLGFGIDLTFFMALAAFFSAGGSLLVVLIGVPVIALGIELCRVAARVERWRMTLVDPRPLRPHSYRVFEGGPFRASAAWLRAWAEVEFIDESRWRDVVYVVVALPLAILEFSVVVSLWVAALALLVAPVAFVFIRAVGIGVHFRPAPVDPEAVALFAFLVGLVLLVVASWISQVTMRLHRAVVEGLLCESESALLRRRVERLRDSRSAALEVEASELRRIERDLHDGAQQRLVMLAIDLSLASERIDADPASAKALVGDAREQARQALAELRDLVRGTAPAILLDRGLVAALSAVAGRCPVPTVVDSSLGPGQRLPHSVERTAYFVVAEALTNVAKHSSATRCEVRCFIERNRLVVGIRDDGVGGASAVAGGGLAGLGDRAQALDGSFTISSPPGGGTLLRVELPLA